jgi:hypothetical protein
MTRKFNILLLFVLQFGFSQNYMKSGKKIISEIEYINQINKIKEDIYPKVLTSYIFERFKKNDSIISNVVFITTKKKEKKNLVFTLLNKRLPEFYLRDTKNKLYSKEVLKGKPTLICIWSTLVFPQKNIINILNKFNDDNKFRVIAFIEQSKISIRNESKINFPIITSAKQVINKQFKNGSYPIYLIVDENNIITYIFIDGLIGTLNNFSPINPLNIKIINTLKNNI